MWRRALRLTVSSRRRRISALRSSRFSEREMRFASSSSSSGSSGSLTSWTVIVKTASLPARSGFEYGSGKVAGTSLVSPAFMPTMPETKPGMKRSSESSVSWPSALPPSNGTPSILPS